jgi:hypothetical protein
MTGFESPFALSLNPGEAEDLRELELHRYYWTGWKRRHWPANILRPGTRLYGFDRRYRALRVLLEVTRGGAFLYKSKREFARKVEQLTGWRPNPNNSHWARIPPASGSRADTENTGIAMRWRVIKPVRIPISGRFPQLGWLKLDANARAADDIDPAEQFLEGDRSIRQHMRTERNPLLRRRAKDLWRFRLGRLKCIACGFAFEQRYGPIGADFIEMHHESPVAALRGRSAVTPEQLKPLCANCHRIVHRQQPMLTITQLKRTIAQGRRTLR